MGREKAVSRGGEEDQSGFQDQPDQKQTLIYVHKRCIMNMPRDVRWSQRAVEAEKRSFSIAG